jgi:hypothetical protein
MAIIPTDELKNNFLGLQNRTRGGATSELFDTFVYNFLLILRGNSIVTKSVG